MRDQCILFISFRQDFKYIFLALAILSLAPFHFQMRYIYANWSVMMSLVPIRCTFIQILGCHIIKFIVFLSLQAMLFYGKEPFPNIYVDSQKDDEVNICSILWVEGTYLN